MKSIGLVTYRDLFETQLINDSLENAIIPIMKNNEIIGSYVLTCGIEMIVSESDKYKDKTFTEG